MTEPTEREQEMRLKFAAGYLHVPVEALRAFVALWPGGSQPEAVQQTAYDDAKSWMDEA